MEGGNRLSHEWRYTASPLAAGPPDPLEPSVTAGEGGRIVMLMMKDGHAEMQVAAGAAGAFQGVTFEFPGKVLSATPVLRGFSLRYGSPDSPLPAEDHNLGQIAVLLDSRSDLSNNWAVGKVVVGCVVNLMDENGDDPMSGTVDFTVIADVLDVKDEVKPGVIEGSN